MSAALEKSKVSLPSDTEVMVTRDFAAPAALVFRAHTEPELMRRWLTAMPGWTMPVCEMDVRVGGKYRWRWRNDENGQEFGFFGEFTEISPPSKLVHTQIYDPGEFGGDMGDGSLISVTLSERNGVTSMIWVMKFKTKDARDAAMSTGMTDGMEMSYGMLDGLVAAIK